MSAPGNCPYFYKNEAPYRAFQTASAIRHMMAISFHRTFLLASIFLFFSLSSAHQEASFDFNVSYKGSYSKVYAFGGSDIDTGNLHFLDGLLDDRSSPNGRLGDGSLVVDFLCDALSLPRISPYKDPSCNIKKGVNFAVAGATTLARDFFLKNHLKSLIWKDAPLDFHTQIEWFKKFLIEAGCRGNGGGSCLADLDNSLFWVGEMGVSDFISVVVSAIPLPHVTEISVRIVSELLKTLLDNGAKYVVVQGLPPVGCLPAYMTWSTEQDRDQMGCVASANIGIIDYNQLLQKRLEKFQKMYPHSTILYADYWNAYLTILTNVKEYHIEEPFKACCDDCLGGKVTLHRDSMSGSQQPSTCKDPEKYISWDGVHLTGATNKKLANLFLNGDFCKPSFSEMVKRKLNS